MLAKRNTGAKYESNANCKTNIHKITAITTYIAISELAIFFVSSTKADIPLILHCLSAIFLNCSIDSNVLSEEIPSLKVTKIAVSPSLYAISFTSSGSISSGIFEPSKSATLATFSTLSDSLNLSSNF